MNIRHSIVSMLVLIHRICTCAYCLILPIRWRSSWLFFGRPRIYRKRGSRIEIGERLIACSDIKHNSIGVFQPVCVRTCCSDAEIVIGNDVGVSGCTISAHRSIRIGNDVLIGSGALITDSDAHPLDPKERKMKKDGASIPVVVNDDVFIGTRAIILKGVTIGKGAVVGAGAVVSKDVPAFSIVAGNPAKVVGSVNKSGGAL